MKSGDQFDPRRGRLRAIAYRMLGTRADADDAVQETWLRLRRVDPNTIEDLDAWLTTVTTRVCLNMLRARRPDEPLDRYRPEPLVSEEHDPEQEALLADAVGVALSVVLETLSPAERMAFVLHDMFAMSFDEIATMLERTPQATRQLASRGRRRVRQAAPPPDPDLRRQRSAVDAYFAAARAGDLDGLIAILDGDVVLRAHGRGDTVTLHGVDRVSRGAAAARGLVPSVRPALVNGTAGGVAFRDGQPVAILAFTVRGPRIITIDIFNDQQLVAAAFRG